MALRGGATASAAAGEAAQLGPALGASACGDPETWAEPGG